MDPGRGRRGERDFRVDFEGFLEGRDRLLQLAGVISNEPTAVMGSGVERVQLHGAAVERQGFFNRPSLQPAPQHPA
jgi:hypothetical protein